MTAINVIVKSDRVCVLTDGASYDKDGVLGGLSSKVLQYPHLNAVIATRGPAVALPLLGHQISFGATSYDDLKTNVVQLIKDAFKRSEAFIRENYKSKPDIDIVVAGISETSGPDAYMVSNHSGSGVMPWSVTPIVPLGFMPNNKATDPLIAGLIGSLQVQSVDEIDERQFGLMTLEIQRASKTDHGKADRSYVGGFAQLTVVSADGISTEIIKRWDDRVGEPLAMRPSGLDVVSGAIDSLAVKSLNIQDNAVIVPVVGLGGSAAGNGAYQVAVAVNVFIDTTGLAGKLISCNCSFTGQQGTSGANTWGAAIGINGGIARTFGGSTFQPSFSVADVFQFTASGGVDSFSCQGYWLGLSGMALSANSVLLVTGAKR